MIVIRPFTPGDIELGMFLKERAGWNQTETDWHRALALEPEGCFIGVCDDTPAATLTTCRFGTVAWVAMVLTDPAFRGRGLATALMQRAVEYLKVQGVESIRLDATALGRPVYEKFGFVVDGEIARYHGSTPEIDGTTHSDVDAKLAPIEPHHLTAISDYDGQVTGNNRSRLLAALLHDWPLPARVAMQSTDVAGFVFARCGSRAVQIGPCIARHSSIAEALIASVFTLLQGAQVYLDVPCDNRAGGVIAANCGLIEERRFFRMTCGKSIPERSLDMWANFGPEKG